MTQQELFQPKGAQAQWKIIFERLSTMDIGDQVTDDELIALLPDAAESSWRGATMRAIKECENELKRSFTRVRYVGYRMVHAREHEVLAAQQRTRARRRLTAGQRKAHAADRSMLTAEERRRIDAVEMNMAQQADMLKRLDKGLKVERQERKAETAQLAEDVASMKTQLEELLTKHGKAIPAE